MPQPIVGSQNCAKWWDMVTSRLREEKGGRERGRGRRGEGDRKGGEGRERKEEVYLTKLKVLNGS